MLLVITVVMLLVVLLLVLGRGTSLLKLPEHPRPRAGLYYVVPIGLSFREGVIRCNVPRRGKYSSRVRCTVP